MRASSSVMTQRGKEFQARSSVLFRYLQQPQAQILGFLLKGLEDLLRHPLLSLGAVFVFSGNQLFIHKPLGDLLQQFDLTR